MMGVQLVGLVFLPALAGSLGFLMGVPLTPYAWLPVVGLLSLAAREQARRSFPETPWKAAFTAQLSAALLALTALLVAGSVLDTSWDGQAYHLRAVVALSDGWNPVWDAPLRHFLVDFLPKSAWVVEGLIAGTTGSLEAAKGIHITMIIGAFALWYAAVSSIGTGRRWAVVCSFLIAANPIAINQSLTFYVDGLVASTFSVVLAAALLWWLTNDRVWLPLVALGLAFLANLKFNGLGLAGLFVLPALLWVRFKAPLRLSSLMAALSAAAAFAGIQGINPYLTNAHLHGHPLYPLMGGASESGIDLIYFRNADFMAQAPPLRLFHSIAARATNDSEGWPRLKAPFTFDVEELAVFTEVDNRIAGWGPLFGGCVLLSLIVMMVCWRQPGASPLAMIQGLIWASVLPAEQSFLARYSPHLWFVPALTLLLLTRTESRWRRLFGGALALTMALNVVLAGIPALGAAVVKDAAARRQLEAMAVSSLAGELPAHFGLFGGLQRRLTDAGIAYRVSDHLECAQPAELIASTVRYCLAGAQSPPPAQSPLEVLQGLFSPTARP